MSGCGLSRCLRRAGVASAILAVATLGGGCSNDERTVVGDQPSADTPAAPRATTSAGTTSVDALADLPICETLPPSQNPGWEYRTLPDWVPAGLPDRVELTDAWTYGPSTMPADLYVDQSDNTRWTLVERDGDRVVAAIDLLRGATDATPPGPREKPGGPIVTSVRGHPGRISRWINPGDMVGTPLARWTEEGSIWEARSALEVDQLGDALAPLVFEGDDISDPTGRFEVLGRRRTDATNADVDSRQTTLELTDLTETGEPARDIVVSIENRPPGLDGLLAPSVAPGSQTFVLEGRPALQTSSERLDPNAYLYTTLADGSLVSIRWSNHGTTTTSGDDRTVGPIDETLHQLVASLRRRGDTDDGIVAELIARQRSDDGLLPLCVEH